MQISDSLYCIYNNSLANFFIFLNMIFPFYTEDILKVQYKTIETMNESIIFDDNSRKRRRFNIFIENLICKNKDFLEKIKQQEDEDDNINNYDEYTWQHGDEDDQENSTSETTDDTETDVHSGTDEETIVERKNN